MLSCHVWLAADYLIRSGFVLVSDGCRRWAVRGGLRFEIPRVCGHADCPPHDTQARDRAA